MVHWMKEAEEHWSVVFVGVDDVDVSRVVLMVLWRLERKLKQ